MLSIKSKESNINEEINKDFTVLNEILEKDNEKENKCLEEYEKIKKKVNSTTINNKN